MRRKRKTEEDENKLLKFFCTTKSEMMFFIWLLYRLSLCNLPICLPRKFSISSFSRIFNRPLSSSPFFGLYSGRRKSLNHEDRETNKSRALCRLGLSMDLSTQRKKKDESITLTTWVHHPTSLKWYLRTEWSSNFRTISGQWCFLGWSNIRTILISHFMRDKLDHYGENQGVNSQLTVTILRDSYLRNLFERRH